MLLVSVEFLSGGSVEDYIEACREYEGCSAFSIGVTGKQSMRQPSLQDLHREVSMCPTIERPAFRRTNSLNPIENSTYSTRGLSLEDVRLLPPAPSHTRRRRMSGSSSHGSRSVAAGSGEEFLSSSTMRQPYSLEPEYWQCRNGKGSFNDTFESTSRQELLLDTSMSPSSFSARQNVWSEAGRSYDETTIQPSIRQFRMNPGYYSTNPRQSMTSRRMPSNETTYTRDESFGDLNFSGLMVPGSNSTTAQVHSRENKYASLNKRRGTMYD